MTYEFQISCFLQMSELRNKCLSYLKDVSSSVEDARAEEKSMMDGLTCFNPAACPDTGFLSWPEKLLYKEKAP